MNTDIHSFQVHKQHSPKQIIFGVIKQTLINLKEWKANKLHSQTIPEINQKSITERHLENPQIFGN